MELKEYLESAQKSLFRFEALQNYNVPQEQEFLEKYKKEGILDTSHMKKWWNFIEQKIYAGVQMQRVRLVTLPLSEYVKMELEIHKQSALCGDDIRVLVLTDELAEKIGYSIPDFWLIDDSTVLVMEYDLDGKYVGFTTTEDISGFVSLKERLVQNTIPVQDFKIE